MKCPHCHKEIPDEAQACRYCWKEIPKPLQAEVKVSKAIDSAPPNEAAIGASSGVDETSDSKGNGCALAALVIGIVFFLFVAGNNETSENKDVSNSELDLIALLA